MTLARLHDGATLEVTVLGDGPAVLLPVSTAATDPATAADLRAWGGEPDHGRTLAAALAAAGFRVVAAGYEDHLARHPKPLTLTADAVAADLLAVADAAGAADFAYYGYSWLALAGLQLALRTDRVTALAMGGYPPLGGPYDAMLAVTRTAHRMALDARDRPAPPPATPPEPGDWDAAPFTPAPDQTRQYVTLYESLRDFDERAALDRTTAPRLAFAGARDTIVYGAAWGDATVDIAGGLRDNRAELTARGWTVELLPGLDHMSAMHTTTVLPLLTRWLRDRLAPGRGAGQDHRHDINFNQ